MHAHLRQGEHAAVRALGERWRRHFGPDSPRRPEVEDLLDRAD